MVLLVLDATYTISRATTARELLSVPAAELAMLRTHWHVWQAIPSPSETGRRFWGVSAMPSTCRRH